jgi:hypothetical protein
MNKNELKEIIRDFKNIDNNLVDDATDYLIDNDFLIDEVGELVVNDEADKELFRLNDIFEKVENNNHKLLIRLNNLLKLEDRDRDIMKLEQQMKKIQVKKYITTSEFEEIYNISKTSQKGLRGRIRDSLPFQQKVDEKTNKPVSGGKITYVVEDVEKWLDNNYR